MPGDGMVHAGDAGIERAEVGAEACRWRTTGLMSWLASPGTIGADDGQLVGQLRQPREGRAEGDAGQAVAISPVALRMPSGADILGSNVSNWLGPPCRNRKMTDLSLSGLLASAAGAGRQEMGQREAAQSQGADPQEIAAIAAGGPIVEGEHGGALSRRGGVGRSGSHGRFLDRSSYPQSRRLSRTDFLRLNSRGHKIQTPKPRGSKEQITMRTRHAFTLLELLIVVAIIAVLAALLLVAVQRARMAADRVTCARPCRQIGVAMGVYQLTKGAFPQVRLCPDTPNDIYCFNAGGEGSSTGPNEQWWAPYDNRASVISTSILDINYVNANAKNWILWPYVEKNGKVFKCPDGVEVRKDHPDYGKPLQISYGMNHIGSAPSAGGPFGPSGQKLANFTYPAASVMLVWDHAHTPDCSNIGNPRTPAVPYVDSQTIHYPQRHGGVYNVLYCDGHVAPMQQVQLTVQMYYIQDYTFSQGGGPGGPSD